MTPHTELAPDRPTRQLDEQLVAVEGQASRFVHVVYPEYTLAVGHTRPSQRRPCALLEALHRSCTPHLSTVEPPSTSGSGQGAA